MDVSILACMWSSEDNLCESILSFCHVDSRIKLQAVRLGSKHLYQSRLGGQ